MLYKEISVSNCHRHKFVTQKQPLTVKCTLTKNTHMGKV